MTISAKIIAHSKSSVTGKEIVTYELEYPRFIHAEFMTHRMFSRNAASSRAIPTATMLENIRNNPAMPEHWGKNQAGMQANEQFEGDQLHNLKYYWIHDFAKDACDNAEFLSKFDIVGVHKQIVNRIVEPFSHIKVVCTATEYDNFFWLRKHKDAQPEIRILAEKMWEALESSKAEILAPGEWHTPYVSSWVLNGERVYSTRTSPGVEEFLSLEDALKLSASLCAQVSYRKSDDSLEKAIAIYDRLVSSSPVHASPFEHQGTPMNFAIANDGCGWEEGSTHMGIEGDMWSGNFKHWIQHRQLIPNNVCTNYKDVDVDE